MADETVVLSIDCDNLLASVIDQVLDGVQHLRLERVSGTEAALRRLEDDDVGLALAYHAGPNAERDIARLLKAGCTQSIPVVVLSGEDNPQSRLRFLSWGAVDCLPCPLDLGRLAFLVDLLTVRGRPRRRAAAAASTVEVLPLLHDDFLVATTSMSKLIEQVRRVAPLDTTVLLTGETGCGKTHAARVIHQFSPRKKKPFVVIECGALTPSLLASELFGHVRGSFTGAERDYAGKLASAEDGTVFLDEIDTMPLECQAKLLRTVDDRIYQAVGSNRPQPLRARLVVATNRPLEQEVAAGRFRSDLYYRLNVVTFPIPPLRERQAEIQPLAERFLAVFSQRAERPIRGFTRLALEALWNYGWPGNIRELRNTVERCVALCTSPTIDLADLPEPIQQSYERSPCRRTRLPVSAGCSTPNKLAAARADGELQWLLAALGRHNHNRTNAAAELGISRVTLYKKLRQHKLA